MSLVLDSSVTLSWCFQDESTSATDELLDRVGAIGAVCPAPWPLEVSSGLLMSERRGRVDPRRRQQLLNFIRDLPVEIDVDGVSRVWGPINQLALRFTLTAYDAAYLELAQRLELPLASLDQAMRSAADQLRISVLP